MKEIRSIIDEKDGFWHERIVSNCDCFDKTAKGGYIRVKNCVDKSICKN